LHAWLRTTCVLVFLVAATETLLILLSSLLIPRSFCQPWYGRSIGRRILERYASYAKADEPLQIFEIGAGNGSLIMDVLDYIYEADRKTYFRTSYNVIEISNELAERQQSRVDGSLEKKPEQTWEEEFKSASKAIQARLDVVISPKSASAPVKSSPAAAKPSRRPKLLEALRAPELGALNGDESITTGRHKHRVRVFNRSALHWDETVPGDCFVIAMEVLVSCKS
jgi:hypothetical protein